MKLQSFVRKPNWNQNLNFKLNRFKWNKGNKMAISILFLFWIEILIVLCLFHLPCDYLNSFSIIDNYKIFFIVFFTVKYTQFNWYSNNASEWNENILKRESIKSDRTLRNHYAPKRASQYWISFTLKRTFITHSHGFSEVDQYNVFMFPLIHSFFFRFIHLFSFRKILVFSN